MTAYTGPNFEIESGAVKEWALTATATPAADASAVLRLGRRVLTPVVDSQWNSEAVDPGAFTYQTVYQDDTLEIAGSVVDVVLPTSGLPGIEYLWQVDLLDPAGALVQRWRGLIVVTASLPAL